MVSIYTGTGSRYVCIFDSAYLTSEVIREDRSMGHHVPVFDGRRIVRTQDTVRMISGGRLLCFEVSFPPSIDFDNGRVVVLVASSSKIRFSYV